jgi:hypothetical protein
VDIVSPVLKHTINLGYADRFEESLPLSAALNKRKPTSRSIIRDEDVPYLASQAVLDDVEVFDEGV